MRTRILTAAILGGALAASAHLGRITTPPTDTTITPGTTVTVKWSVAVVHGTLDLAYSQNGSTWTNIKTDMGTSQNSFNWAVPANFPASTTTRLRVCQRANSACTDSPDQNVSNLSTPKGGAYTAVTGNFKIGAPVSVGNPSVPLVGTKMHLNTSARAVDLSFDLARPGRVTLQAFDTQGKLLAVLLDASKPEGHHALSVPAVGLDVSKSMILRLQAGEEVLHLRTESAR